MGRITSFSKQVVKVLICFCLVYTPFFANAAGLGGWSLGSPVASGASAIVNGTKEIILNGASKIAKGTAKITPNPSQVAKVLARGAAGYALSLAVEQLLGAVDWVLDPANNQITYTKPSDQNDPDDPAYGQYLYGMGHGEFLSPNDACRSYADSWGIKFVSANHSGCTTHQNIFGVWKDVTSGWSSLRLNPAYNPAADDAENDRTKHLPLETVAQQVISNAAGGDVSAQQAITAAAQDVINEAENDTAKAAPIVQQLEASKAIEAENTATGEQTQNPEKPNVTDISLEFPAFCGWAPLVCEAAQTVISFPTTLADWWNTGKTKAEEWATSISEAWAKVKEEYYDQPEENTDTELEIPDLEQDIEVDTDIAFGGSCPAPLSSDINFMGLNKTIEFSFDPVCQIAEFIKPVVISISAFSAALIVAGIRTEDD